MKKIDFKQIAICGIVILASSLLRAISMHVFITPNNFAPGGVTGIASMLQYKTGLNAGYFILGLNLPLLVLSAIYINKGYTIKSTVCTLMVSGLLIVFEKTDIIPRFVTENERILAAIAAGVLGGAALALMLKINGSSGGTEIVAALIQKKFSSTNVAWFILMCDAAVVLSSLFVYGSIAPVLLALAEIFVAARVAEAITQGLKTALKFEIVTESPQELSDIIFTRLNRGVTCIDAKGMFSGKEKSLLICIVRKTQIATFRQILREFAQDTFTYISRTSEVVGKGFQNQ